MADPDMSTVEAPNPVVTHLPQEETTLPQPERKLTPEEKLKIDIRGVIESEAIVGNIDKAVDETAQLSYEFAREKVKKVEEEVKKAKADVEKANEFNQYEVERRADLLQEKNK